MCTKLHILNTAKEPTLLESRRQEALACKRYRIWGSMFLTPEDLDKVRVSSLLRLVANTGLNLVS
jgi:hypothetical protein